MAQDTSKKVLSLAMGTSTGLSALETKEPGRILFVTDTGKMLIDVDTSSRVAVNADHADSAGSATQAGKWTNARTITVGSTGKSVDGSEAVSWSHAEIGATVSNKWTAGTSAGPKISTTVNGVTGTSVAIPSASASASGIVTTGAQTFAGEKTFNSTIKGSISGNAGGTASGWTTARTFSINGAASDSTVSVDGKNAVALNLPTALSGFTSIAATTFTGNLSGNATSADTAAKTTGALTIQGNGTTIKTFDGSSNQTVNITATSIGALSSSTKYAGSSSQGGAANSVANSLTIGGKTYNGSAAVSISLEDLGLSNAIHFIGSTSTTLADEATTSSITIGDITYVTGTPTSSQKKINAGDVVLSGNLEYIWTGSKWEVLGNESSYALRTVTVTGTGALGGGGNLTANRTITHNTTGSAAKSNSSQTKSISGSGASNSFTIPVIDVDTYGHVKYTADSEITITMPTLPTLRNFTVQTSTTAATANTVKTTYDPDGSSASTLTIYKMAGATTSAAGYQGLVPAPAQMSTDASGATIYTALLADGSWGTPSIVWGTF